MIKREPGAGENAPTAIQDGRGAPHPYTMSERIRRAVWTCFYWTLYRWVPRFLNEWHRGALRMFGAKIGSEVLIYPSALIECPWNLDLADNCVIGAGVRLYALGPIRIGEHSVVSQLAHLCAGRPRLHGPEHAIASIANHHRGTAYGYAQKHSLGLAPMSGTGRSLVQDRW